MSEDLIRKLFPEGRPHPSRRTSGPSKPSKRAPAPMARSRRDSLPFGWESDMPVPSINELWKMKEQMDEAARKQQIAKYRKLYKTYVALNKELAAPRGEMNAMLKELATRGGKFRSEAERNLFRHLQSKLNSSRYGELESLRKQVMLKLFSEECPDPALVFGLGPDRDEQSIQDRDPSDKYGAFLRKAVEKEQRRAARQESSLFGRFKQTLPKKEKKEKREKKEEKEKKKKEEKLKKKALKEEREMAYTTNEYSLERFREMVESELEAKKRRAIAKRQQAWEKDPDPNVNVSLSDDDITQFVQKAHRAVYDTDVSEAASKKEKKLKKKASKKKVPVVRSAETQEPDYVNVSNDDFIQLTNLMTCYKEYAEQFGVDLNNKDWKESVNYVPRERIFEMIVRKLKSPLLKWIPLAKLQSLEQLCQDVAEQIHLVRESRKQLKEHEERILPQAMFRDHRWVIQRFMAEREKHCLKKEGKELKKQLDSLNSELNMVREVVESRRNPYSKGKGKRRQ